ncbi:MAG: hypothetical protein L0206_16830 [Actinobacteria bacterium]|nr:hypothetical protein [Actinomycetota bacterium]
MTNPIPTSTAAAAQIVAARRLAQLDQSRISDLAKYRAGIARKVHEAFDSAWRRLLETDPYLDALQLANAVEPVDVPEPRDPYANEQAAFLSRAQDNDRYRSEAPATDQSINAQGLARARAALRNR